MSYAVVVDGTVSRFVADLPRKHWISDSESTGWFVTPNEDNAADYGYLPFIPVERPADTALVTWERTLSVGADSVTVVWVEVAKTPEQIAAETQASADDAERQQARQAVENLRAYRNLATPTAAQRLAFERLVAGILIRLIVDQYGQA